jgi:CRP/FNR family transcriptional regulator, cyclic AMP receptor protein
MNGHGPGNEGAERAALVTTLRETWFGAGLDDAILERLASLAHRRQAAAGEIIVAEGSRTDEFGVVVSGRLALRMLVPERGMTTILTVEPGDLYGWSAIVPPNRATSTVTAVDAAELVAFNGMELRMALAADPVLAAAVYPRVLQAVSRRLEATRLQLLDLFAQREQGPW